MIDGHYNYVFLLASLDVSCRPQSWVRLISRHVVTSFIKAVMPMTVIVGTMDITIVLLAGVFAREVNPSNKCLNFIYLNKNEKKN